MLSSSRRIAARSILLAAAVATPVAAQEASRKGRFVTVADVIRATVVGDPEGLQEAAVQHIANSSPDGQYLAVVVRHGNVEENTVESSILVFTVLDVVQRPRPDTIVTFASSSDRPAITHVRWLANSLALAFLGERPGELPQVYTVDIRTRVVTPLTEHPTPIKSYDMTSTGATVAYTAELAPDTAAAALRRRHGYLVTAKVALDAMLDERRFDLAAQETHAYIKDIRSGRVTAVSDAGVGRCLDIFGISLSPDGGSAIRTCVVLHSPARWTQYADPLLREALSMHAPEVAVRQYVLIDAKRGTVAPLLDAPLPTTAEGSFVWAPDGQAVAIANAFLPLDVTDSAERARRTSTLAVAEVDLATRKASVIAYGDSLKIVRWDGHANAIIALRGGREVARSAVVFRKAQGRWTERTIGELSEGMTTGSVALNNTRLTVTLEQGLNEPPVLVAGDPHRKVKAVVLNPNPQFQHVQIGKVEAITWTSKDGSTWRGGLYYPPDYVSGVRYPLVIQTHGFDTTRFSLDGPYTTAFAAQPLAAHDIIVLQVGDPRQQVRSASREASAAMSAFESAIDYLDQRHLVDRGRVGLIGFSRTCWYVKYTLAHSRYRFAAASVSDGIDNGYVQYMLYPTLEPWSERDIGAIPFQTGLDVWRRDSPGFNMDRIRTPLHIEAIGAGSILGEWEMYAGLRRLKRPVEMSMIPEGTHQLVKPWERLASLQGNVDWFRFWLKGEEDPDPAKREQYARWRELRQRQQQRAVADTAETGQSN
jgi:dipeptidyl aminopeptidase/acylaminoacyl peptidase